MTDNDTNNDVATSAAKFDRIRRALAGHLQRHDAIGIAVDDQRGHIDLFQIIAEVGTPESADAVQRALGRGEGGDLAVVLPVALADQQALLAVEELGREVLEKGDAVAAHEHVAIGEQTAACWTGD